LSLNAGETMKQRNALAFAFVICSSLLFLSCSRPPDENLIKKAITEHLEQKSSTVSVDKGSNVKIGPVEIKGANAEGLKIGTEIKVESVEIKQIGNYNEPEKYWPVKARVTGTSKSTLVVATSTEQIDREMDFKLYQDEFGNWKAGQLGK
jgi:hypothetical protein